MDPRCEFIIIIVLFVVVINCYIFLFKMDGSAVIYCPESFLIELGLKTKGDLYALRLFCEREEKKGKNKDMEERKQHLIEKLRSTKGSRVKGSASESKRVSPSSNIKPRWRKFEMGWLHFSEEKGRYLAVRQSTGGGTRSISLPGTSKTSDIIDEARNLFFPQGESTFGSWLDMDYDLANFRGEKMDKLTTSEGKEIEFSLQSYFNLYKLTRVRLCLKTKRKEQFLEETKVGESDTEVRNSRLLGSSQERAQLKETQNEKYEESLRIDRAKKRQKEEALMEEISRAKKVEEIHAARLGRVLEEPGIDEPRVVVRVRHIDLGLVKRAFKPYQAMAAVYDWIGSLQLFPVYFSLCTAPGDVLDPSLLAEDAEGKVLFMEPRDDPIPLCADDLEITFRGFGQHGNAETALDDSLFDLGEIGTTPPLNLLAGETDSEEDGNAK